MRELLSAIRRACVLSPSEVIGPEALGLPRPPDEPEAQAAREPLDVARDRFLKAYVQRVVEELGGNRTAAAAALGVTPRTVFKYLDEV